MTKSVHEGRRLEGDETIEADVVVIGTGAGGAVVGKELQERDRCVVFLEEGEYFTHVDFNRRPVEMGRLLYRNGGTIATLGRPGVLLPLGRAVGGTTTINSGTCSGCPRPYSRSGGTTSGSPA